MNKKFQMIALITTLVFGALACNFPTVKRSSGPQGTLTALAQTLPIFLTQTAIFGGLPTAVTATPTATAPTPTATMTQRPANTSVPPVQVMCDHATFIADVTISDGTILSPNQAFTKTWRLKNTGSCTWSTSYALIFESGTAMNGPSAVNLPGSVAPGQQIDLSVNLTAPASAATYRGNWKLRNSGGATFGIGPNANTAFWVEIKVVTITPTVTVTTAPGTTLVYDLATNYCAAEWVSGAGVLPCPGLDSDEEGFVIRHNNPTLENGALAGEVSLETHPEWLDDGVISGLFPAINVQSGYRFRTRIGCMGGGASCNVKFQLNYHADGGALQPLGDWTETYNGTVQTLDVDLSSLAGKSVEFALAVTANGSSGQDWALWIGPRIVK